MQRDDSRGTSDEAPMEVTVAPPPPLTCLIRADGDNAGNAERTENTSSAAALVALTRNVAPTTTTPSERVWTYLSTLKVQRHSYSMQLRL